jgi:hypothetical protein
MAAGGIELAPEGPGPPERIAGQSGVETTDGDRRLLQRRDDPTGYEQVRHHPFRISMLSPSARPSITIFPFYYSILFNFFNLEP